MKFRALCSALRNTLILKFFAYLIICGFCMPSFDQFDYYFAIEELKIEPEVIAYMAIWTGFFVLAMPVVYLMLCKDTEYYCMFTISQIIFIIAYIGKMCLAHRWLPTDLETAVYFLTGTFAESFERAM